MRNLLIQSLMFISVFGASSASGQSTGGSGQVEVAPRGDSVIAATIDHKPVRVILSTYQIEIGTAQPSAVDRKTNCLYTRRPCSQVSNISIWVGGKRLFVPRSVFADCTDLGAMWMTAEGETYVLNLGGGDGAEAYTVKIYFNSDQIKRREVYDGETKSLLQTTVYMPPPAVE